MGSNPTHVDWVESMDLIILLLLLLLLLLFRNGVMFKPRVQMNLLTCQKKKKKIYIYIYIYVCMYVCMYMCVHGSWGFFN